VPAEKFAAVEVVVQVVQAPVEAKPNAAWLAPLISRLAGRSDMLA
jgi:hypothetical protein